MYINTLLGFIRFHLIKSAENVQDKPTGSVIKYDLVDTRESLTSKARVDKIHQGNCNSHTDPDKSSDESRADTIIFYIETIEESVSVIDENIHFIKKFNESNNKLCESSLIFEEGRGVYIKKDGTKIGFLENGYLLIVLNPANNQHELHGLLTLTPGYFFYVGERGLQIVNYQASSIPKEESLVTIVIGLFLDTEVFSKVNEVFNLCIDTKTKHVLKFSNYGENRMKYEVHIRELAQKYQEQYTFYRLFLKNKSNFSNQTPNNEYDKTKENITIKTDTERELARDLDRIWYNKLIEDLEQSNNLGQVINIELENNPKQTTNLDQASKFEQATNPKLTNCSEQKNTSDQTNNTDQVINTEQATNSEKTALPGQTIYTEQAIKLEQTIDEIQQIESDIDQKTEQETLQSQENLQKQQEVDRQQEQSRQNKRSGQRRRKKRQENLKKEGDK
ncbi:hypothetical protein CDIK_1624 [Cucumispora dikerogammari]|nr:hypothetical protein CDIK_1624 [Cucumispora dikerogammari]